MLHNGEHDLVTLANDHAAIGLGDKVDGFGGVARKDYFIVAWCVDEVGDSGAGALKFCGSSV